MGGRGIVYASASSIQDDASAAKRPYGRRMGLLRNRTDGPGGERFLMREKLLSIGDDFWIENEEGERAYKVDGKAVRVRQTFVLEDASGDEVARIQERKLSIRDRSPSSATATPSRLSTRRSSGFATGSPSTWRTATT